MNLIEKNINDILDSTGKNNNFLNDKPYSEEYKELALKWSKLPMYTDKKSIKQFFELLFLDYWNIRLDYLTNLDRNIYKKKSGCKKYVCTQFKIRMPN